MASKSKAARAQESKIDKKINFYLIAIPVLAFVIKLITMANIRNTEGGFIGGWLGADGENYLSGVDGLLSQGYLSDKSILSYWPAGYPILIWLLTMISLTYVIALISCTQTLFYAYASYYFVMQLRGTKLQPDMFLIGVLLAFNPTLSLSSLAVGYESPIAACMLIVVGLIMKSLQSPHDRSFVLRVISAGFFSALATFMQPRWVLTTVVIALLWALMHKGRKAQALILVGVVGIMALAPAIMIQRNIASIDKAVVSTNITAALKIGTGPETSGGYNHTGPNIECESKVAGVEPTDNEFLICAAKWYLQNPLKTLQLSWNKSIYFWSPWSGPLADGTMARNPWLKINPISDIARGSQNGNNLVFGLIGKVISWLWLVGGLVLMILGFEYLRRLGGRDFKLGVMLVAPILASWLSSVGTIGDHRFRIPTMSLSLVLQVLGFYFLKKRLPK